MDHYGQYLQQALQQPVIVIPPLVDNQPHVQVVDNPDLPPAVAEGGLHDHPVINPQIVEAVNIPPIEDMSDTVIAPPPFSGKPTEDPGDWLRAFSNYSTFKGYNDAQKRNLFRVLLTGPAADWLDNRTYPETATFDNYKTDFEARYKTPEVMKYKSARQIFTRRQEDGETTDDYSTSMIKLGKVIDVSEDMLRYAILNGLKPDIATYVTQRNPQTLEELLAAARVAELTLPPAKDTSLHAKVDRLMESWEKLSTAQVQEPTRSRPQSPNASGKTVTFNEGQTRYMGEARSRPYRSPQMNNNERPRPNFDRMRTPQMGQGFRSPGYNRGNNPYTRFNPGMQMQQGPRYNAPAGSAQWCAKCGRQAHSHINYCPAINAQCWTCGKRGHLARVCRWGQSANTEQSQY